MIHKYNCPCCGYYTLDEEPPGTFQVCPVCYWEDDNTQFDDPTYSGGANENSLELARLNFLRCRASSPRFVGLVRDPLPEEEKRED
jgi:hypothetical protein